MPLNIFALISSPGLPGAGERDYPGTGDACADEWAAALQSWASMITPPSTTVVAATSALRASLRIAFAGPAEARLAAFRTALLTWATTLGSGMAPFVAVPPVTDPFATAFVGPPPSTRAQGVANVAASLTAWAHTGTATLAPAAPVPWS